MLTVHSMLVKNCLHENESNYYRLKIIWDSFLVEIVKDYYMDSRSCFKDGIDYQMEVEAESDSDLLLQH